MSARHLTPRAIRKALGVVDQLPAEALADLIEALVNKLDDAAGPSAEDERDDDDGCPAEDVPLLDRLGVGDMGDAEEDNEDRCPASDDDLTAYLGNGFGGAGDLTDAEDGGDREPDHDSDPLFPPYHHGPKVIGARCWTGAGF